MKKNQSIGKLNVWLGKKNEVNAYIANDIYKTIPKARKKYLKAVMNYEGPIHAPIAKDQLIGKLKIFYKDDLIEEHNLLALEEIKRLNIFSRILKSINYIIWGDV